MVGVDALAVEIVVKELLLIPGVRVRGQARFSRVLLEHGVDGVEEDLEAERDKVLEDSLHVNVEMDPCNDIPSNGHFKSVDISLGK